MRLITILTKGVSDPEAGQTEAQHCDKSQNIHGSALLSQIPASRFLCNWRGALRPVDAGSAPTETECRTQSLQRGLTAYHPGSTQGNVIIIRQEFQHHSILGNESNHLSLLTSY